MPTIITELQGFELYAWVTTPYLLAETAVIPISATSVNTSSSLAEIEHNYEPAVVERS